MKSWLYVCLLAVILSFLAFAVPPPKFLELQAGCFEVSYSYVEESGGVRAPYDETIFEWITLKEEPQGFRLQHYGIFPQGETTRVQKHWSSLWKNQGAGGWQQIVFDPKGEFRYECTAPVKLGSGGLSQRRCQAPGAPKPRRDMDRTDYDTLDRFHLVTIKPLGWIDTQHNHKRTKADVTIGQEFGWNEYKRASEAQCEKAIAAFGR